MTAVAEATSTRSSKVDSTSHRRVELTLRLGAAACFIGHGAFGILTKQGWLPYFAVAGIGPDAAYRLMPLIGFVDITAGLITLVSPRPVVLLYMTVWGAWTALLRPLAGESPFETLERAGNYGVPLALFLWYARPASFRPLFRRATPAATPDSGRVARVLLASTATLLFAHGALQTITQKPLFTTLYGSVGIPGSVAPYIGSAEMVFALLVVIAPLPSLLVGICLWKVASESLFPISGTPIWEFVERAGSYAAPLALAVLSRNHSPTRIRST